MRAACALLIAILLPLPTAHAEAAGAVSAPAGAEQAAAASVPAAATEPAAPVSGAAALPPPATAISAPPPATAASAPAARPVQAGAASAPSRAARKQGGPRAAPRKRKDGGAARTQINDMDPDRNPVIEAINLVANTQRDEIKAADRRVANADWWLDALDREWIVKRPFGPGLFDTTHWFYVSYKVNGRLLMSWFVDLTKGTVSPITPPDTQSGQR